jgi:hypothetical protein
MRYKIEVQDDTGIWSDVRGDDGNVLVFDDENAARSALAERFPILVQMEKYAGGTPTRLIRIFEDEDDGPARPNSRPQTKPPASRERRPPSREVRARCVAVT